MTRFGLFTPLAVNTDPQDMTGLLLKEAVYTAIGKSATDLTESLNFEDWLRQTLMPEVGGTDPK